MGKINNMEVQKTGSVILTKTLKSKGTLRVRIEQDGTVSVDGYLYWRDGKPYEKQMQFLDEAVDELTKVVAELHNGIPESKDKKWYEFWRIK